MNKKIILIVAFLFFVSLVCAAEQSFTGKILPPPIIEFSSCNNLLNGIIGEPLETYHCLINLTVFWDDEQLQTCTILAKDDKNTFNYESKSLLELQIGKELEPNQFTKTEIFADIPVKYNVLGTYDVDFSLKCGFWSSPFTFQTKRIEIIDKSPFKQFTLMSQQVEFAKEQSDLLKEQLKELKIQRNETSQQFKVSLDYIIEQNNIAKNALYLAITLLIVEILFSIIGIFREDVKIFLKKSYRKIKKDILKIKNKYKN